MMLAGACGDGSPATPAQGVSHPSVEETLPAIGREQHVLLIETEPIGGMGLRPGDTYPARLETALRARGLNVRLIAIQGNGTLKTRLVELETKPDLVLVSTTADAELITTITGVGLPVYLLDLESPLKSKPDLFVRGTRNLNVQGVEELVGATADGIAQAFSVDKKRG